MQFEPHREHGVLPLAQSINSVQESIGCCENPQNEHMNTLLRENAAFFGAFAKFQKASFYPVPHCPSAWNNSVRSMGNFLIISYFNRPIFRKAKEKIQVSLKSDKNSGTSHEDLRTFTITSL
jgi:hypothetical protein